KSTPLKRRMAAWLYAQFSVSKTVSLTKFIKGLTPIRESDLNSPVVTEMAPKLGGLVEFYRSPDRVRWTPTGTNVPDYPRLAQLWWQNISLAINGEKTPQQALDKLASQMDRVLGRLERLGMKRCSPKLEKNPKGRDYWLSQPGSPKAKMATERPMGQTVAYETLLKEWSMSKAKKVARAKRNKK
ncbi:MAG: carbohydrate ABC transporter substrate-binding protein, partial [Bdellovibrionota bacterium]|nr:carbohydrate ABC transporter substrate-binding protein [Bdellovibrionota bacterium]